MLYPMLWTIWMNFKRDKNSISWEDAKKFIKNLYDKLRRNLPVEEYENQLASAMPQDLINEVNQEESYTTPVPDIPKIKRVDVPDDHVLTAEEKQNLINESPEALVINTFFPEIFDDSLFFSETSPKHIDASINTFAYLRSLGYTSGMWNIGPEHNAMGAERPQDVCSPIIDGIPICDRLDTSEISLDWLITNANLHAQEHSYYPPKSIIATTHPGCKCHVLCWAPISPNEIPDSAPGVPTFGTEDEKIHYKNIIHQRLQNFEVDRWTILHPSIYEESAGKGHIIDELDIIQASLGDRKKFGKKTWKFSGDPVLIKKDFLYKSFLGTYRPISKTYNGLCIEEHNGYSKVFIGELSRNIIIPSDRINTIFLKKINFSELNSNMYIKVDDTICMVIKRYDDDKVLCYEPELDSRIIVEDGIALDVE